ncbi:MAG: hypothetical protein IPO07_20570 [Haliscomenobacter sp.]|nr:hypothetical protein [Haliscomenobacter sp.]MBK9490909.1 hypothetical protein [Haliscomenobacter sp.]
MVILAYEAGTELYHFLVARAKENRSLVLKTLAEFILFSAVLFILWYIGKISYTVMTGDENEYSRIAQMRFWIIPAVALHLHWFYRCIPIIQGGFVDDNRLSICRIADWPNIGGHLSHRSAHFLRLQSDLGLYRHP